MLGLGSALSKSGKIGKSIVKDGLVLKHDYGRGSVEPVSSGAASFNGTSDYIQLANAINYSVFSISAWVNVKDDATSKIILDTRDENEDGVVLFLSSAEQIALYVNDSNSSVQALTVGVWQHVVGTYDGADIKLYVDGVLKISDTVGSETVNVATAARIGENYQGGEQFLGYMANVGFWSAALTQAQIKSIMHKDYASLSASEKTNLVSWWNLDSVIDSADANLGSTAVYDNHHGGGDVLGANLVAGDNSVFNGTSSDWIVYESGSATSALSYDGSRLIVTTGAGADNNDSGAKLVEMPGVVGKTYHVEVDVWMGTYPASDQFKVYLGGSEYTFTASTTQTTFSAYFTAVNTGTLTIYQTDADESGTFFIDNVSVKLVNGNTGTLS